MKEIMNGNYGKKPRPGINTAACGIYLRREQDPAERERRFWGICAAMVATAVGCAALGYVWCWMQMGGEY